MRPVIELLHSTQSKRWTLVILSWHNTMTSFLWNFDTKKFHYDKLAFKEILLRINLQNTLFSNWHYGYFTSDCAIFFWCVIYHLSKTGYLISIMSTCNGSAILERASATMLQDPLRWTKVNVRCRRLIAYLASLPVGFFKLFNHNHPTTFFCLRYPNNLLFVFFFVSFTKTYQVLN